MPDLLSRTTQIHRPGRAAADLDRSGRMDRMTAIALPLLFDLTQQAARFGSGIAPWGQLALYDVDDFAPFIAGGSA
ncbi:hypothetical protein [Streptomyces mirabilis]